MDIYFVFLYEISYIAANFKDKTMEAINAIRKYNKGFKTLKDKDIHRHAKVSYGIFHQCEKEFKSKLTSDDKMQPLIPSDVLIYITLLVYRSKSDGASYISHEKITKLLGYARTTIHASIKRLVANGWVQIKTTTTTQMVKVKDAFKKDKVIPMVVHRNIYFFPHQDDRIQSGYERFTYCFVEATMINRKEKEFLAILSQYILPNDCIGSVNNPASMLWITKNTCFSYNTVRNRIVSLMNKGIISTHTHHTPDGESFVIGYKIKWTEIMMDTIEVLRESSVKY